MGFGDWLLLLFIGLRLTGHIKWHWVWVLSPVIVQFAIGVCLHLLAAHPSAGTSL